MTTASANPDRGDVCKMTPILFSQNPTCNGGYQPRPCTTTELQTIEIHYYDWNLKDCTGSRMDVCPDEDEQFYGKVNGFRTRSECMMGMKICPLPYKIAIMICLGCVVEAKCLMPFGPTWPYKPELDHFKRFSYNQRSKQCEPYIYVQNPEMQALAPGANHFFDYPECASGS